MKTILPILFAVAVLFALPVNVYAQGTEPASTTGPQVAVVVLDVVFLAAITAFIKKQFELSGRPVMYVAFGVGVVIWGTPLISQAFPTVGIYLDSFMSFLKLWIGAMGSTDLVTDIGSKVAAVKPTKTLEATLKPDTDLVKLGSMK